MKLLYVAVSNKCMCTCIDENALRYLSFSEGLPTLMQTGFFGAFTKEIIVILGEYMVSLHLTMECTYKDYLTLDNCCHYERALPLTCQCSGSAIIS